jgi:hypothetical protein
MAEELVSELLPAGEMRGAARNCSHVCRCHTPLNSKARAQYRVIWRAVEGSCCVDSPGRQQYGESVIIRVVPEPVYQFGGGNNSNTNQATKYVLYLGVLEIYRLFSGQKEET